MNAKWDADREAITQNGHIYKAVRLPSLPGQKFYQSAGYVLTVDGSAVQYVWDSAPRYGDLLTAINEVTA